MVTFLIPQKTSNKTLKEYGRRKAIDDRETQGKKPLKACVCYFHEIFIFSPNDSPSKTEKCFLFHLKSSFRSRDIQIFVVFSLPFHTFQIEKDKWK